MSNLTTATTDSKARFVRAVGDAQKYGFTLVRRWEDFHAAYADTMVTTNKTKRYTNPKADKQQYTGTFIQSSLTPEVKPDDTIDLVQTLVKVRTQATDSNAQFVRQEGDPQHAGYRLVREWAYFDPEASDTCIVAEWGKLSYTNPKADHQAYTGTFVHSSIEPVKSEDRTVTIRQTITKAKSTTDSADADLLLAEGDPGVVGSKITRAWHYIDPVSSDGLYTALNAIKSYSSGIKASAQLYAGKYVVSRIYNREVDDRTHRLEQTNTKVRVVTSDTSLMNPLVERRKNEIHPFGEGRGTSYGIVFRYPNLDPDSDTKCMAIADTTLEAKMGSGYDLIDRKTTEMDDNTMTFWMLSEKKSRIAWSNAVRKAPDHIQKDNPRRDDEIKTKIWFGIDNSCDTLVRAKLVADTNIDTGYSLIRIAQTDNDDGSDDWQQVLRKRHNDTRTDSRIESTHSLEHVAIQAKHTEYKGYTAASLPSDPALTGGYKFVSKEIMMDNDGLLIKQFVQEKPVASNTVDTHGKPARFAIVSEERRDVDTLAGWGRELEFDRVPINDADTAMINLRDIGGDTYIVGRTGYSDLGNGSARIVRKLKAVNKSGKYYVQEISLGLGHSQKAAIRVWPDVTDTKAAVIVNGIGQDTFAVGGINYPSAGVRRDRQGDGTSTVIQTGSLPKTGYAVDIDATRTDSYLKVDYVLTPAGEKERTTWVKKYSSLSDAITFVENIAAADKPYGRNEGRIDAVGDGKYIAYKVKFTAP